MVKTRRVKKGSKIHTILVEGFFNSLMGRYQWLLLVAQMVKHLPVVQETRARSLGWEGPLEKEMATHSSTLAWTIPWTEESDGL